MKPASIALVLLLPFHLAMGQSFIASLEESDMAVLFGQPAVAKLADGSEVTGKLTAATMINGYLDKFTLKNEAGEKVRLEPEDVVRLSVKASKLAKVAMGASNASSLKEITNRDFNEISNREYIIFETAMRANKAGKLRLMQLLNPGFDTRVKVFADPNAQKTGGLAIGGIRMTGGEDRSFLMVKGDKQAVVVRKSSYRRNFEELYGDCPAMVKTFAGEKIQWDDLAGHVFAYDSACQ